MKMKDSSSTEIVADEIFSGTWYLVAIPGENYDYKNYGFLSDII
jgi:hypothetical protein